MPALGLGEALGVAAGQEHVGMVEQPLPGGRGQGPGHDVSKPDWLRLEFTTTLRRL
ncbi:MAG: hypothetical protein ACRENX_08005 [Candidatus Dormibacteria bacterium]